MWIPLPSGFPISYIVVRGNEKNYARFISYNLPEIKHIDVAYFEDTVAKAILFKAADKRYGTKVSGNQIGEMKQVVIPYTVSLLNIITEGETGFVQNMEKSEYFRRVV